ncbi:MAG: hypothetical protein KGL39_58405, partial [Patescibacteria group bacterium]|nr:hypothetical protein [Patescibacteria group bacterium]
MPKETHPFNPADLQAAMKACGEGVPTFAKGVGTAKTAIYQLLDRKHMTEDMLGRINKYLASKHVPPVQVNGHAPEALVEKPQQGRKQMVPSGFLMGSLQRLGITQSELARLTGASLNSIQVWIKRGFCPLWFRAAVNGLMAEAQDDKKPAQDQRKAWQDTTTQPLIVVPLADLGRA